jgi:hypothetical protein
MSDTRIVTYRCRVCGVLRGATNHWRIVFCFDLNGEQHFGAETWDDMEALQHDRTHVCGERCALVLFERWLATGKFDVPQPNKITA